jgi:hypothetical protein
MKRNATPITPSPKSTGILIIRMAVPADASALRRLAQLDSAPPPEQVAMLVAAVDGDVCAALPLNGGTAIANPFRRTTEIVDVLAARARQLQAPTQSSHRRPSIRVRGAARAGARG